LWFPTKILSSTTVLNIENNFKNIRMISEGSCATEDWSNDTENSGLLSYSLKYIPIENSYLN